jgi:hypothetical protein
MRMWTSDVGEANATPAAMIAILERMKAQGTKDIIEKIRQNCMKI